MVNAAERLLKRKQPEAVVEWVRAYTTLTVFYDPWLIYNHGIGPRNAGNAGSDAASPYELMCAWLGQELEQLVMGNQHDERALEAEERMVRDAVVIPVRFGGEAGPDLPAVAERAGLTPEEAAGLYCSAEYAVHMIGFSLGFPYLGGLPERLGSPRRSEPRTLVPAGSVGIAGMQTGIYPLATPGDWQLIGRTPLRLFDPARPEPSLLQPGDRLRFEAITQERYVQLEREAWELASAGKGMLENDLRAEEP